MTSLQEFRRQLTQISTLVERSQGELGAANELVSKWSTCQHLDHVLKVGAAILDRLRKPAEAADRGITMVGRVILFLGVVPRGRGKSPEQLRGTAATREELLRAVAALEERLSALDEGAILREKRRVIRHPVFGGLNGRQSLRVLTVHTAHHLKIIADISRA